MLRAYFAMPMGIYKSNLPKFIQEFILSQLDVSSVVNPSEKEYQSKAQEKADNFATLEGLGSRDPQVGATRMAFFENLAGECDCLYFLAFPAKVNGDPFYPKIGLKIGSGKGSLVHTNNRVPAGVVAEIKAVLAQGKPVFEVIMDEDFSEPVDIKRVRSIDRPDYSALPSDATAILNRGLAKRLAETTE